MSIDHQVVALYMWVTEKCYVIFENEMCSIFNCRPKCFSDTSTLINNLRSITHGRSSKIRFLLVFSDRSTPFGVRTLEEDSELSLSNTGSCLPCKLDLKTTNLHGTEKNVPKQIVMSPTTLAVIYILLYCKQESDKASKRKENRNITNNSNY
jgi:hypothetical protein